MKEIFNNSRIVLITYILVVITFIGIVVLGLFGLVYGIKEVSQYKVIKGNPTIKEFVIAIENKSDYEVENKTDEEITADFKKSNEELSRKINLGELSFNDLYNLKDKTYRTQNGTLILEKDLINNLGANFKEQISCEEVEFSLVADKIQNEREYKANMLSSAWISFGIGFVAYTIVFSLIYNLLKYCNYIRKHYKAINSIKTEIELLK